MVKPTLLKKKNYPNLLWKFLPPSQQLLNFNANHLNRNLYKFRKNLNISILRNKPFINTHNAPNFISSGNGFLLLTKSFKLSALHKKLTSTLKRKYYSFSVRNELQKFIIKKYVKESNALNLLNRYTLSDAAVPSSPYLKNEEESNFFKIFSSYGKNSFVGNSGFFRSFSSYITRNYILHSIQEEVSPQSVTPHIKKIRFKPGYMTIWREARSVLKQIWGLNFRYQYRLTRYLAKFHKLIKTNLFLTNEMELCNLLVRLRIFVDTTTIAYFIKSGVFYINGNLCFNPHFQLHSGDFLQMVLGLKYYISYRWFIHWIGVKKLKLRIRTRKKLTISFSDEDKTKTRTYPLWILNYKNFTEDTPPFLELDFLTLSAFVIHEPAYFSDINMDSFMWDKYPVLNMYNWKYIN